MYKIMLVEDEPPILNMIKNIIDSNNMGFMVCSCAYNGREALRLFENEVPDVLITDIRMPFVDGLQLIDKVNELYPGVKCIILSGFSDFEYARSAIRLNVFEYLLKPIEQDKLFSIIFKLKELFDGQKSKDEIEYLKAIINFEKAWLPKNFKMEYTSYYVILAFAGPLSNQFSEIINPGKDFWSNFNPVEINKNISYLGAKVWTFNGKHFNEKIFVVASDNENNKLINRVCSNMMAYMKNDYIAINIIYSNVIENVVDLGKSAKNLLSLLSRELIFGESNLYNEDLLKTNAVFITPEYEKKFVFLVQQSNFDSFKKNFKTIIVEWKELRYKQIVIQTLINYLINLFHRTLSESDSSRIEYDANEIVSGSLDYDALYEGVCCACKVFYDLRAKSATENLPARDLVDRIERYLLDNYTTNITYKVFYEMFGYNETYITNLFRTIKGISPSKYVTKLRMEKAQDIIAKQPDMLLKNVSEMVGYEDPLYFSRVFKESTGFSPREYAKKIGFYL